MEGLIEFLESASGPFEASKAWEVADRFNAWGSSSVERELFVSALQGSIDAALALAERVLPGEGTLFLWHACVGSNHPDEIPRLLCAALLRASAAEGAGA